MQISEERRREGFSLRRRTLVSANSCRLNDFPADCEDKFVQFQRHVIYLRKRYAYEFSDIGNANESFEHFDTNFAVNSKGGSLE
ncbi:hypothetical protein TNCT_473481 [Trichonephila clavata]|uniref:Uncharacterized protein n=1 Tax=Trichonephila clavata TaxID=2740835 RepID=A0A8X6IER1_TRICU|nr:hypothetical protein TNCT_473481 [Trichonephila clavata]